MALWSLLCWLAALALFCPRHGRCIVIEVYKDGNRVRTYEDSMAESENRADYIHTSPLRGQMYFAVPRNACDMVEEANETTSNWIALIDNYLDCPDRAAWNLYQAGYGMMLAYSPIKVELLSTPTIPRALITSYPFLQFLRNNTIIGISPNASEYYVKVSETTWYFYEKLFMIFGGVLMAAVTISIIIFCGSLCCRTVVHRWRTRGLSRWRVRQLPKRKYKKGKETSESCSICLEDFRVGENLRVLPCDHIFHPSCVDEWLQKWNRTCPLCKSTIQRKKKGRVGGGGGANRTSSTAVSTTSDQERVRLLAERESVTPSVDGEGNNPDNYGATRHLGSPILDRPSVPEVIVITHGQEEEVRLGQNLIVTLEEDPEEEEKDEEREGEHERRETREETSSNLIVKNLTSSVPTQD